jgi:xylan 1,4-beta-xylosidase
MRKAQIMIAALSLTALASRAEEIAKLKTFSFGNSYPQPMPGSIRRTFPSALSTFLALVSLCIGHASASDGPLGMPLRDAAITIIHGVWYLTGTVGTYDNTGAVDFDYNGGTPLWHSADGKSWKSFGLVWDRAERFAAAGNRAGKWQQWTPPGERLDALLANATTTPNIYRHQGEWYLLSAQNHRNIFVFKSESGRPEGPYADHANLATDGGYPSFFFDDDGTVYLVLADGWIAPVRLDLSKLIEPIRRMETEMDASGRGRLFLGERGICLFKRDGRYYAFGARWTVRDGKPSHDAFLWIADAPHGPYRQTDVVLPGAGPVRVVQHPDGNWHAVSSYPVEEQPAVYLIPSTR